jgi:hypothetical protein
MYLLWILLNFGLFISFFVICFKAAKLIREKLGLVATLVFVTGLLSFLSVKNNISGNIEAPKHNGQQPHFVFKATHEIEPHSSAYGNKEIDSYVGTTINMEIVFGKELLTAKMVAVSAYFDMSGLLGGHVWSPHTASIKPTSNPSIFNYKVRGSLKWLLLGLPVFSQSKMYQGTLDVKNSSQH